ncbi:egg cell-secreted protein 1.2-like [Corylus avellana]|uniref:egg cell-secreted protein 1.2-like n=1 Tax=Corylus avellana TaxID=13451 RepID=UPI001E1EF2C2|nr:egg cell-secreted protein 1.2-like [Corylus avellana]
MASTSKLSILIAITLALSMASMAVCRPLDLSTTPTLKAHSKLDGDSTLMCWNSLLQLQACTGDILLFFLHGEITNIGASCCQAVRVIGHQCLPEMFRLLGLTNEEGLVLEGYCDRDAAHSPPPSPLSLSPLSPLSPPSSTICWDSLLELQACTGEVVMFLLNGKTYLGPNCCQAIRAIEHQCWPEMFRSLGFTIEEGDILQGYCEAAAHSPLSLLSSPSLLSPPPVNLVP